MNAQPTKATKKQTEIDAVKAILANAMKEIEIATTPYGNRVTDPEAAEEVNAIITDACEHVQQFMATNKANEKPSLKNLTAAEKREAIKNYESEIRDLTIAYAHGTDLQKRMLGWNYKTTWFQGEVCNFKNLSGHFLIVKINGEFYLSEEKINRRSLKSTSKFVKLVPSNGPIAI